MCMSAHAYSVFSTYFKVCRPNMPSHSKTLCGEKNVFTNYKEPVFSTNDATAQN